MEKIEITRRVEELCIPIARDLGLQVVLVQYRHENHGWVLRILVDRSEGHVTIDDCSLLSRELSDVLDIEDLIDVHYNLEVSSPGLDRPLVRNEDFDRFTGYLATITMRKPVSGRRNFRGTLGGIRNDMVVVKVDGLDYELKLEEVQKANLVPVIGEANSAGAD